MVTGRHKISLEDHFDKYYELEYNLQKVEKDRDLREIRKITDLADICYVHQKERRALEMQSSAVKDTSAEKLSQYF